MTEIKFRSDLPVELVQHCGSDEMIVRAARVSTLRDEIEEGAERLIRYLVDGRHGSPFEHCVMTWRIEAPIFVWREFMRHRIASYNEASARYTVLPADFYIPPRGRNLVQTGKPGAYMFSPGTDEQYELMVEIQRNVAAGCYDAYEEMLEAGIAKEVARNVLPVNIYSRAYVTMNVRALTNMLSLRTKSDHATFPSFPQHEINVVANQMEAHFREFYPTAHRYWDNNGRVPL